MKDDVGRSKPSARLLPKFGHSYGYAPPPDKEGVGQLLTNWTFHQQTRVKENDKDFKELNRLAIKNKATTSDKQYSFRQQVNARLRDPKSRLEIDVKYPFGEDTRFGTANRPSTPIKAVVEGFFGDVGALETKKRFDELQSAQSTRPRTAKKMSEMRYTKASQLAREHIRSSSNVINSIIKGSGDDLFKMAKFKNVAPRTDTHNGSRSALTSHRKTQSEGVPPVKQRPQTAKKPTNKA